MTKKDQIKHDIINVLGAHTESCTTKTIFLHLTEKFERQLSLSTLRRYLKELVREYLIYSKESTTADKNKSVWSLVESNPNKEQEPKPEPTPESEKADTPTEEKDMYEQAIISAKEVLDKGVAAKVVEQRDNASDIVWTVNNFYQLGRMVDRWAEMKSANYKRINDIVIEATEKPVQPDLKTEPENNQEANKKSEPKRYAMDERIQMKKFFINLGANETRATELVKDVVAGRNTEENIEKTLREEKQAAIGLVTPKTQHQRTVLQLKCHDHLVSNFTSILKMDKNIASKIALNLVKSFKTNGVPLITITDEIKKEYEEIREYLIEADELKEYHACKLACDSVIGRIKDIDAEVKKIKESYKKETSAKSTPKKKAVTPKKVNAPKKKASAPKKKRYTRANALAEAINGGTVADVDELIEKSNELYVKNGGKNNPKEAKWFANYGLGLLESMGILEWKEDGKAFFNHLSS